jgi:hypothetical protein
MHVTPAGQPGQYERIRDDDRDDATGCAMGPKAAVAASFHHKIYDHTLTLILMVAAARSRQLITFFYDMPL